MKGNAEVLGYVLASNYRKKVLVALKDKAITPMTISEKTGVYPTHVSTTLSELTAKNLVICLTPKLKKGRLYELTSSGKNLVKNLN